MGNQSTTEGTTAANSDSPKQTWPSKFARCVFAISSTVYLCGGTVLLSVAVMRSLEGKPVSVATYLVSLIALGGYMVSLKRWLG